jgi:hypothetical protein
MGGFLSCILGHDMTHWTYDDDACEWFDLDKGHSNSTFTDEEVNHGFHVFIALFVFYLLLKIIELIIN